MMEWLFTYVVHSTALIAFVWLLTTVFRTLSLDTRQTLWRVALFGPLLTATVHQAAPVASVWGQLPLPAALSSSAPAGQPAATPAHSPAPVVVHRVVRQQVGGLEITAIRQPHAAGPAVAVAPAGEPGKTTVWPWVLLGLWGAGAVVALGRLGWAASRLRRQLKGRRDVIEDPVLESFLDLCSKAGLKKRPRLTASAHLRSPIALGRREICLPERAVDSLSPEQQRSMLAHEMAHLLRRDPVWTVVAAVVEAVFFFQPLNHLARRKLQEVAEFQCDDWAAKHTGTGVHLAKCLAEVAGWVENGPAPVPTATAMADRGSPVVRRITRLLHPSRSASRVHPVGRGALSVACLGLAIALVPGVSAATDAQGASDARSVTLVAGSSGMIPLVVEDRSDAGHDRSRLLVQAGGETVEIEVQAARPRPVAPVAPPPPPRRRGPDLQIRIHGHMGGCCGMWLGGELDGLFGALEGLAWIDGGTHGLFELDDRHHDRLERRLERMSERLERKAERLERELSRHEPPRRVRPAEDRSVFEL